MSESIRTFKHFVRVPYAHTDQMGFVYYANYLVYFEMARSEMLREVDLPYTELEKRGLFLPVVEAHCKYKSAAHFDDRLEISSQCQINGARLRVEYKVERENELIVTGYTVHVCVSDKLKIMRPPELLQKLVASGM